MTRAEALAAIDAAHQVWVAKYADQVWAPQDADPGPKGTDYPLHSLDRSAPPDLEAEFAREADTIMAAYRSQP